MAQEIETTAIALELSPEGMVGMDGQVIEGEAVMIDDVVELTIDGGMVMQDGVQMITEEMPLEMQQMDYGTLQMTSQQIPIEMQSKIIIIEMMVFLDGQLFQIVNGENVQVTEGQMFQFAGSQVFKMQGGFIQTWSGEMSGDMQIIAGNNIQIIGGKAFQTINGQQILISDGTLFNLNSSQVYQIRGGLIEMVIFESQSQVINNVFIEFIDGQAFQLINGQNMQISDGQLFQTGSGQVFKIEGGIVMSISQDAITQEMITQAVGGGEIQIISGQFYKTLDGQSIQLSDGELFMLDGLVFQMQNGVIEILSQEMLQSLGISLGGGGGQIIHEMSVSEIPLESGSGESLEMSVQEMPLDATSQELIIEETPLEMTSEELAIEEIPLEMTSEVMIEETPLDMTSEGLVIEETPLEMTSEELIMDETSLEMTSEELVIEETPLEMASEELVIEETPLETTSEELVIEETPLDMTSEEVVIEETPLEMTSEELVIEETPLEMTSEELVIEETPLETTSEEFVIEETPLEMTSEELVIEETPLEMTSEELVIEETPLEMTSEELVIEETPLEMTSEELVIEETPLEMTPEELVIEETPLEMTSEELVIEETPLEMTSEELVIEETPLEMTSEELVIEETPLEMTSEVLVVEETPLEMTSEELVIEETPLEMTSEELVIEEAPVDMTSEEVVIEETPLEMTSEELVIEETPLEMTSEELVVEETPLEMTSEELVIEETPLEMASEELVIEEAPLDMTSEEVVIEETPLEMTSEELVVEETPLEMTSEELVVEETPLEMTSEELVIEETPLEMTTEDLVCEEAPLDMTTEELVIEETPLEMTSEELVIEETPLEMTTEDLVCEEAPLDMTTEEMVIEETPLDLTSEEDNPIKNKTEILRESNKEEILEALDDQLPEKSEKSSKTNDNKLEVKEISSDVEEEQKSTFSQGSFTSCKCNHSCTTTPRYEESCHHKFMLEEFREKIIRIEKEKEYLEGKYDELRREKPLIDSYRHNIEHSSQFASQANSEMLYTPRSECHHCESINHTCSRKDITHNSSDSDYYKLKCDLIRKEKENLELAYHGEKQQKEDIEREYENERNEKQFIERRYETMLESITRFEDTIRELRQENENLQTNLNEWTNLHKAQKFALAGKGDMLDNAFSEDSSSDIFEYKRSIEVLERENKEFREILEAMSKKSENQDNLKGIELGLVREKEFLDLKRERAKFEDIIREQKRTIGHQQERIEEIRREHDDEIWTIKETSRKNERKLKEIQKCLGEKDREIDDMKRVHVEEIHVLEIKLQSESSCRSQYQTKVNELEIKIQRIESEKLRLNERINSTFTSQSFSDESYGEDISGIRQRLEDEQRSKVKLANDIKYLLQDIIELKDRNKRMESDVNRERMEIKNMLEKQANEITQVYLTQITKLQGALSDEIRRREMIENGMTRFGEPNYQQPANSSGMQPAMQGSMRPNNNFDTSLREEIKKREALEVENKNLLYEMNKLLGGLSMDDTTVHTFQGSEKDTSQSALKMTCEQTGLQRKNKELMHELAEMKDSLDDMETLVRKNKNYKNKIEDLQDELDHVTRKRDDLATSHRNMKRDVEQLSMTLEDVQRKNRQYTDECDRLIKRIQELEDSFKFEKSKMVRNHEIELENILAESEEKNEELKRQVDEQLKIIDLLRDKATEAGCEVEDILELDEWSPTRNDNKYSDQRGSKNGKRSLSKGDPYISSLKKQVEKLENKLKASNKRRDEEIKEVEKRKNDMKAEFEKEKQALRQYFNQEKILLERRFQHAPAENGIFPQAAEALNALPGNEYYSTGTSNQIAPEEALVTAQEASYALESVPSPSLGFTTAQVGVQGLLPGDRANVQGYANQQSSYNTTAQSPGQQNPRSQMNDGKPKINGMSGIGFDPQQGIGNSMHGPKNDFEKQIRDVEERFAQDKQDILQKSAEEKRKLQQDLYKQKGQQENEARSLYNEISLQSPHQSSNYSQSPRPRTSTDQPSSQRIQQQLHKAQSDIQKLQKHMQKQRRDYEDQIKKLTKEKQEVVQSVQHMNKEISVLKCERRNIRCSTKSEIEKVERMHEIEKTELRENHERNKRDEVTRIRAEYDDRMTKERKRLQSTTDELRQKISVMETKLREVEVLLQNERHKFERDRVESQKTISRAKEEYKVLLETEYKKRLSYEKQKFEKTLKDLRTQISSLQEQRRQIQQKLSSKDSANSERITRERMILQIEQDFLEKMEKEKKPLEEKISDLREELSKMKREKNAIKTSMEKEKEDLQEEVERVKDSMKDKLQKAKNEMERRSDMMSRSVVTNRNMAMFADIETQNQAQSNLKHYQEQVNILEQRNMNLNSKNERLEREVRVLKGRVTSLESRNRDLTANATAAYTYETSPRNRTLKIDLSSIGNSSTNFGSSAYSRQAQMPDSSLMQGGEAYNNIFERVRQTMNTAGNIGPQHRFAMPSSYSGARGLSGSVGLSGVSGFSSNLGQVIPNGGMPIGYGYTGLAAGTSSFDGMLSTHTNRIGASGMSMMADASGVSGTRMMPQGTNSISHAPMASGNHIPDGNRVPNTAMMPDIHNDSSLPLAGGFQGNGASGYEGSSGINGGQSNSNIGVSGSADQAGTSKKHDLENGSGNIYPTSQDMEDNDTLNDIENTNVDEHVEVSSEL